MNQYDAVADDYARLVAPKYAPVAALVADRVVSRELRPTSVVELAAGTGALTRLLAPRLLPTADYLAVDISPEMLRNARQVVDPRVRLEVADLVSLPIESGSVDLVVSSLGPMQDSEEGWAEAARILRPSGRVVLVTWGADYSELDLIRATRRRLGEDEDFPKASIGQVAGGAERAGFGGLHHEDVRLVVEHASVEDYLAYRCAFGRPPWVPDDRLAEVLRAIACEAGRYTDEQGRVVLDWTLTLVEATRGPARGLPPRLLEAATA